MNNAIVSRFRLLISLIAAAAVLSCSSDDMAKRYMTGEATREQLRTIQNLDMQSMRTPPPAAGEVAPEAPAPESVSLTLEEVRADAIRHNLELTVSLIDPAIAAEGVNQAEAAFEPSLTANASYAKIDDPVVDLDEASIITRSSVDAGFEVPLLTGGLFTIDFPTSRFKTNTPLAVPNPAYQSDVIASIAQPLLRNAGFRVNTYAIRIAMYQKQAVEAATKLEVITVISAIDKVYWRLYAAQKALEVRVNEHALAVAQLERAKRLVAAGVASEVDVIRAEAGVAEKVGGIITTENIVRQRQRELKRAINAPGLALDSTTTVVTATPPNPVHYSLDRPGLVAASIDNRMDLLEAELQIAADAATIDFARNQTLPALALEYTFGIGGVGDSFGNSFNEVSDMHFQDNTVALHLAVPLGNELARSKLRQAVYTKIRSLATRDSRVATIKTQVLDSADSIETNWQRVVANQQSTVLAARTLEAEIRQFELGLRTSTDVLDAQTKLANAQLAELDSLVEYQAAQVDLAFSTGTLLGEAKVQWAPTIPDTKSLSQ